MGIYIYRADKVEGPFDELLIQQALMNGTMSKDLPCCKEGSNEWTSAANLFSFRRKPVQLVRTASSQWTNIRSFWSNASVITKILISIPAGFVSLFAVLVIIGLGAAATSTESRQPNTSHHAPNYISVVATSPETRHAIQTRMDEIERQVSALNENCDATIAQFKEVSKLDKERKYVASEQEAKERQGTLFYLLMIASKMHEDKETLIKEHDSLEKQLK